MSLTFLNFFKLFNCFCSCVVFLYTFYIGDVVIIENVGETLDPTLDPVLARAVYKKGRNLYLRFGGEEIAFDPLFKLYLTSKLSNPHYSPETLAQTTLINFIATEAGTFKNVLFQV